MRRAERFESNGRSFGRSRWRISVTGAVIKQEYGVPSKKELNALKMLCRLGRYDRGKHSIPVPRAAQMLREAFSKIDFLAGNALITVIGTPGSTLYGSSLLKGVLHALLQMSSMVTLAFVGLGVTLVGVCLSCFYFFSRLVRHEYQFHRGAWEKDGRPVGFFPFLFRPPEATWWGSGLAAQRCTCSWFFHTPLWVHGDPIAKTLLSHYRWGVTTWNVGSIASFILFLFYSRVAPALGI